MSTIQISKEIRSAIKSGNLEKVVELIGSNIEVLHMITLWNVASRCCF